MGSRFLPYGICINIDRCLLKSLIFEFHYGSFGKCAQVRQMVRFLASLKKYPDLINRSECNVFYLFLFVFVLLCPHGLYGQYEH